MTLLNNIENNNNNNNNNIDFNIAKNLLLKNIENNSAAVYSLDKSDFDLEKMKQDSMVYFWLSEVNIDDEF
jgi:hypothetical protein